MVVEMAVAALVAAYGHLTRELKLGKGYLEAKNML